MSYNVYKQFGRVIGQREMNLRFERINCPIYKQPYLDFLIWIEQVKRYIKADIKLKSDNPFGCLFYICIILIIFFIMLLGKLIL